MLNGSALLRVFLVVVAAAILTGLVQHYWIFDSGPPEVPVATARPSAPSASPPRSDPIQASPSVQAALPAPSTPTVPASPPAEPIPAATFAPNAPPAVPDPPIERRPSEPPPAVGSDAVELTTAPETSDPRAVDLVDLNTGTLSELNGLKGGGAIGRAIIQRRPYASTDQLLSKRVLSRAVYQRIKDQITVR